MYPEVKLIFGFFIESYYYTKGAEPLISPNGIRNKGKEIPPEHNYSGVELCATQSIGGIIIGSKSENRFTPISPSYSTAQSQQITAQ